MERRRFYIIAAIILGAVLIRAYNINGALFDFNPLRQAMGTAIARNFALDPGSSFLLPRVDNEGAAPGYFMFELPVLPYAVSFLYRIVGQANWIFRLPVIILFAFSAVYFYKLCSRVVDFRTAALALIFYTLAPVSIVMGRVFQAESFMLFALFAALYYLIRWFEEGKPRYLFASTFALTVLVLLKITNLYVFLFIAALFFIYRKTALIPYFILPACFVLMVNFWWWGIHSAGVRAAFPTDYTQVAGDALFGPKYLFERLKEYSFSAGYWALIARQTIWIIFSPLIFVLFIGGLFIKKRPGLTFLLVSWLVSALFFIFAVPIAGVQDYYKIHFLPAGAILAAICYFYVYDKIRPGTAKKIIVSVFWILASVNIFLIVFPIIKYKPIFECQQDLGKKVEAMTRKDDLVLTAFGPDAMLLYYCNRKGWSEYLPAGKDNIGILERRRAEGAAYFVCGNLDELDSDPGFKEYLFGHYNLVAAGDRLYSEPVKRSLDYFSWKALNGVNEPFAREIRKKLERRSLGYVIFDLRRKP
ncbi:MAG: glycosyltransferase family 39 protein [Candidatus Omnitrophota bacterium]